MVHVHLLSIIVVRTFELTIDAYLGLLDLGAQFFYEDRAVTVSLLALLHLAYLELCVPVEALDNIFDADVLVELLLLWVIRLYKL